MPVITVDWWQGNDRAQRAQLVKEVTDTVSRVAGCPTAAVTVLVRDVDRGYWGMGGELADAGDAQPPAGTPQSAGAQPPTDPRPAGAEPPRGGVS
ncbi:4-oxalocrotonate tautomerase family protein [Streptomyces sp. NPDC059398]|uniref:tautomerase family protein n=1 Tax=Streptomyces sp. NPDC059398 TaxID=3346820 RepID=UPI00368D0991